METAIFAHSALRSNTNTFFFSQLLLLSYRFGDPSSYIPLRLPLLPLIRHYSNNEVRKLLVSSVGYSLSDWRYRVFPTLPASEIKGGKCWITKTTLFATIFFVGRFIHSFQSF